MNYSDYKQMCWASSKHPNSPYKAKANHKRKRKEMPEDIEMFILSVIIFLMTVILIYLYC